MKNHLQNTSLNDHIWYIFKPQNTSDARFGILVKLSSQGMSNSFHQHNFQQQLCENARALTLFDMGFF